MSENIHQKGLKRWLESIPQKIEQGSRHIIATYNYNDVIAIDGKVQPVRYALNHRLAKVGYDVYTWSFSRGFEIFRADESKVHRVRSDFNLALGAPDPGSEPLETFRTEFPKLEKIHCDASRKSVIIIRYGEHLLAEGESYEKRYLSEIIGDWPNDALARAAGNVVIIFSKDGCFDTALRENWDVVPVPLPIEQERFDLIERFKSQLGPVSEEEQHIVARQSSGLRNQTIAKLIRELSDHTLNAQAIKEAKKTEINHLSNGMLEVVESEIKFKDIAGLDYIKNNLKEVLTQLKTGDSSTPRGMIFVGPPGLGKSYIAEAFANESDFVFVNLRNVRSKWVGDSERNMDSVLNVLESLSPCIVAMDEMDQQLGKRGGGNADGGVSSRIFARLLEFMGSDRNRGRIMFLGMSNFPTLLDPAVVDRFSKVIPFLYYQPGEYAKLLKLLAKIKGLILNPNIDLVACGKLLMDRMISPRRVVDILSDLKISCTVKGNDNNRISEQMLLDEISLSLSNHNQLQIERMSLEAIRMSTNVRQLPWYGNSHYQFQSWIKEYVHPETGIPDFMMIDQRLVELRDVL